MQKTNPYLPLAGFAATVSILAFLYYEKRRKLDQVMGDDVDECSECTDEDNVHETDDLLDNDEKSAGTENQNEVVTSSSLTGYSSFDDDDLEMQSCRATNSSTSAYSTASDDNGPFPVGEFSTYKQNGVDIDLKNLDLHEILNSPVVEDHCKDERMNRSPTRHGAEFSQYYNSTDTNIPVDVESTKVNTIVAAYNDIVPPLRPNTGRIIHSPKVSDVR
ncbi:uncharacterized protein LOC123545077 [Mercenaria mercenaria]|uniref:uncharacterized protein LOC123545077 n=1 Tax=Mercenaria mercenaria TaxID=6596 RepID=UPI00234EBEF4|nr:uncharacterized protein LOC123545077 [Mercenaria mercenaria]